ncbi:hypothetical protein SISSUDRAFT_625860 [Sistotremastrum suecicum HHB10207 ss-3]|uniref:DUF6535 domain-containing protein n=1 Tax=Sistotremastrum suecicum HHB10207 ss-3 TaxID=1314776 RepID=A0A165XB73_9AGAM|nr:hypothetical protein SISSUDRAFT_625860 [Sistotremastrum suecicum HHB10207 ss-3]
MFSICNSVMCVLGLQWAGRLLSTPLGRTNLERALNRERRKVLAQQRLLPLMGVLFWTLLLSIAFFVIGFLVQFWALSFSFDERAPILIIGAVVATALALTILGVILATTYHATVHENSPFESPLSSASIAISAWLARMTQKSKKKSAKGRGWYQSSLIISHLNGLRGRIQHFARRISHWINPSLSLESSSNESSEDAEESCNETVSEEDGVKEEPIEALTKENEEDDATVQALKAYARLVLNTNDAEVLERAVPSFEIGQWYSAGVELWDLFLAVRERFLATDTSFRVKETVTQQLVYFMQWSGWRNGYTWRDDLEGNAITRWCTDQCKNLVDRSHESHRQFFFTFVFLTSLDPHNSDLRGSPYDSYERTVARVLCSFDRGGELILGFRENVFSSAVQECRPLLRDAKSDDVTRILSIGDRSSIIRSLLRNPHISWDYIGEMVALITRGNEVAILEELAEFFCNVPDMKPVGIFSRDLLVIDFLGSLIPSLPPRFTLPRSFDLTPTLSLLLRYQSKVKSLERYIDTLLYFLDHDGFEQLSSLRPAHDFFRLCLTRSSNHQLDKNVSDRARFYLSEHHGAFTPLPRPSDQDFEEFGDAILAYARDVTSQEL